LGFATPSAHASVLADTAKEEVNKPTKEELAVFLGRSK
jgi:hypothetical protein